MRYISIFSGIEAASVAWEPLGWEPVAFSEIDEFPSAVLKARYPDVPNLGDITKVDWTPYRGTVDLVVGGSPCQSFSIAGKREGLSGASGLMWEYVRCIQDVMPEWAIWENVPGAFSVERGRAFGQLLESLDDLGYGLAWRVLDAQFMRVPERDGDGRITRWVGPVAQRRRRVFLVGHLGDMRAAEVLFEPESMRWDTASSKQKRQALAADARRRTEGAGECLTPWDVQSKRVYSLDACGPTLNRGAGMTTTPSVLAFAQNQRDEVRLLGGDGSISGSLCATRYTNFKNETLVAEPVADDNEQPPMMGGLQRGHRMEPIVLASDHYRAEICEDMSPTILSRSGGGAPIMCCQVDADNEQPIVMASGQFGSPITMDGVAPTITALHEQPFMLVRTQDGNDTEDDS